MAVVLPILAVAGGAMGAAAAGSAIAAGVITAATVASAIASGAAIVSGVAAMAGKPKVARIAGLVALGAGAFGLVSGATASASSAATPAAEAAAGAAPSEAESFIGSALEGSRGNTAVVDNAASTGASTIAEQTSTASNLAGNAGGLTSPVADTSLIANPLTADAPAAAAAPGGSSILGGQTGAPPMAEYALGPNGTPAAAAAKTPSLFDRVAQLGKFAKDNKELLDLAGGALKGAFGPEQQLIQLREQQLAQQQAEIDRSNRNSNNIVGLRPGLYFNPAARPGAKT